MKYHRILAIVLPSILFLSSCTESPEIQMVKSGHLGNCPNSTVEEMVDGFLGNPAWNSGESSDGQKFVNIEGDFTISGKEVRGILQFAVDTNAGSFKFYALETNGVPQPNIMALGLLNKMCNSGTSDTVANVANAFVESTAVPKFIAVETCQDDNSITELSNAIAGLADQTAVSEYFSDIQLSGSCAAGEIFITVTTTEATGKEPFHIVLAGTSNGAGYSWTCFTDGDKSYMPEACH